MPASQLLHKSLWTAALPVNIDWGKSPHPVNFCMPRTFQNIEDWWKGEFIFIRDMFLGSASRKR